MTRKRTRKQAPRNPAPEVSTIKLEKRYLEIIDGIGKARYGISQRRWRTAVLKRLLDEQAHQGDPLERTEEVLLL